MKTALVTGSSGFVGRHFARYLEDRGWCLWLQDTAAGIDSREFFREAGNAPHFDLVVHCAAVVGGRVMIDGAPMALAVNLELDAAMFQWAMRARPGRVLYFSSSAAYPAWLQANGPLGVPGPYKLREPDIDPSFSEPRTGVPDQLYGWAKLTGENLAHRARAAGLSVSVVRPFSGYGSDQADSYPFPAFIDRALRRDDPFVIWGDGSQVRDFIHVDDIVRACMTMCEQAIDGPVNLGTGRAVTMTELGRLVCEQAHYRPEFKFDTAAPRGVSYRVSDSSRLREFYVPEVSLERGIAQALAWRRERRLL